MPYMGYYGIDMYYIVLVLPCVLFAFWAQSQVNGTFNRYSRVMSRRGLTGAQAAQAVLRANGVTGVSIEYVAGKLTDHFDPRTNTIRLSASVYQSTSVASIGVAAHEAGHAVQYAVGYSPIRLRNAIVPLTQVGATAAMPLILMGLVLNFGVLIKVGIIAFALSTVFQLVTLPVEINASRRALAAIGQTHMLDEDEYGMAKKTLTAAAMTYVAALAVSLAQLLRLLLIFGGRNRDDRSKTQNAARGRRFFAVFHGGGGRVVGRRAASLSLPRRSGRPGRCACRASDLRHGTERAAARLVSAQVFLSAA